MRLIYTKILHAFLCLSLLLGTAPFVQARHPEAMEEALLENRSQASGKIDFGTDSEPQFTAPSKMWIKSILRKTELPLKYGNNVEGIGQTQVFLRYAQFEQSFLIGSLHYHAFPYSKKTENDTPAAVKIAFKKMHKLNWVGEYQIADHTWVFQGPERSGPRFFRAYFTKGKTGYSLSTAVLRNAYVETTMAESQWLQNMLMLRFLNEQGMKSELQRSTFFQQLKNRFSDLSSDSFINILMPKAVAQGAPVPNCPPPPTSGGPVTTPCPSSATCTGLFPTAQAACLANIASCQQGNLGTMFNAANGSITGIRTDINCESNKWASKIDGLQTWLDQKIAAQEPRIDRLLGQVDRGLDIVDRLTDPVHMAGVAAMGAIASTLATGAISLAVQGIGEGLSFLYKELSGQNEEELMRKRAEAFSKAKEEWEKLNGELVKIEESIDTSTELLEVIKASGLGLEDFIRNTKNAQKNKSLELSRLNFKMGKMQKEYEKTDDEGLLQCLTIADQKKREMEAEVTRLSLLGEQLDKFKKKNNSFEFACKNLSRDLGSLLAKEALIEKARSNMGLYFAASLWVEQKDAAKRAEDQQKLVPMKTYETELEAAQMEFYNRFFPPVINTQEEEKVNCKKVLNKVAQSCADQNKKWYDYLPFSPTNLGQIKKCGVRGINSHAYPSVDSAPMRNIEPGYYRYLLGTYAKNLVATGKVYDVVGDAFEAKCVRLAVDNYSAYANRIEQAKTNYEVDKATWNQRLFSFNSYYTETSEMINNIKIESACGSIAETGCYEGEEDCEKLKQDSCYKNLKRLSCSQHKPGDCPVPSGACSNPTDTTDYCRYQFERIKKCKDFEKDCTKNDYPMDCGPYMDRECRRYCEDIYAVCREFRSKGYASFEACKTGQKPKFDVCTAHESECLDRKSKCVKSSFSNARFRFERFKTMRKYLDENLCLDFGKKK